MRYTPFVVFLLCLAGGFARAANVPAPAAGGNAIALLVLTETGELDAQYLQELTASGYRVSSASFTHPLSPDYLRQFGAVILSRLPYAGQQFGVGQRFAYLAPNLQLIHEYLAAGGGVVLEPAMSEFGEAYADTYNKFLQRYGAQYLTQQLRDDAETKDAYAAGIISSNLSLTKGLQHILYPINVMRWDNAYSTTPFTVTGKEWTVLAMGKPTSGTYQALDNSRVGERLTTNRNLFALRHAGKGYLLVSAIHSYYTLTHAYSKLPNLGENSTGVIDGIPLHGEAGGRPSDTGKLLDRAYRLLAANSVKNGLGSGIVDLPAQPPLAEPPRVIDWHTAVLPPTWRHVVTQIWHNGTAYYDELPDAGVVGEMKYFKALVGARTAYSSGTGTIAQYRTAAIKAGYSAIAFTETLADMTPAKWSQFVKDCDANTDDAFACLPGLDLEDFQGGHYLVIGARRFPDPAWLTADGKKLKAVRMLSLGWFGHIATIHRAGRSLLSPKMYKHFQGVSVYTYNTKGKLVDDALFTYQWQVGSDSNPIPIAAHEVTSPDDVAIAATAGFQQILPAPALPQAIDYFRFGFPHYFECPLRYFISEGPLLDGWSIWNKDIGDPTEGRDHYRLGISVTGADPIAEATLYDGPDVAGRWFPKNTAFSTQVDGFHESQHEYLLLAKDSKGRRVLSPGIRTVSRNWRLRCGDRQNWLGSLMIYTGWHSGPLTYSLPIRNTREGGSNWLGDGGGNPSPILDFPLFSNHVQMNDIDLTTQYVDTDWELIGGDAKPTYAVRPSDFTDGHGRLTVFSRKTDAFDVLRIDMSVRLKRDIEPELRGALYPVITGATGKNDLLILPGKDPVKLSTLKGPVDLPVGSYVGGIVTLTPGLRVEGRQIGFPSPPADTLTLYEGTTYAASYLLLKGSPYHWKSMNQGFEGMDAVAEPALAMMGFRGTPPYALNLREGTLDALAYTASCTARDGGIAGECVNANNVPLLDTIPLVIKGLNPRCASALWRADASRLEYFAAYQGAGLVTLNADKTVAFYAGNVATCDPALFVSVVVWNAREAWFRVNNPTTRDITTTFATAPAITVYKPLTKQITVKAGTSVDVKE